MYLAYKGEENKNIIKNKLLKFLEVSDYNFSKENSNHLEIFLIIFNFFKLLVYDRS